MERLSLTHKAWYDLSKGERDLWLAREADREVVIAQTINAIKDQTTGKMNAHGINALLLLRTELI
jgi:hypothetical protein